MFKKYFDENNFRNTCLAYINHLISIFWDRRINLISAQKMRIWVFNDQPCECADVGHSGTIGRAAKMGWKKNYTVPVHKKIIPFLWTRSDFIYTKNSARPGSDFPYTKNRRGRDPILSTQTWYLKLLNPSIPKAKGPEIDSPKKKDFF